MKGNLDDLTTPAMRQRFGGHTNGAAVHLQGGMFSEAGRATPPKPILNLPPGAIGLGLDENNRPFGIDLADLMAERLLIQGNSGAGKSWLMRKLLEESSGQVQQIILDPEQEFLSLAEMLEIAPVG